MKSIFSYGFILCMALACALLPVRASQALSLACQSVNEYTAQVFNQAKTQLAANCAKEEPNNANCLTSRLHAMATELSRLQRTGEGVCPQGQKAVASGNTYVCQPVTASNQCGKYQSFDGNLGFCVNTDASCPAFVRWCDNDEDPTGLCACAPQGITQ